MSKSALIIVDMVRDFTDPNGLVYYPQNREILPQIRKVLDKCREKGLLIVFMQHCNRKGKVDRKAQAMRPNCIEGKKIMSFRRGDTVDFLEQIWIWFCGKME